MKMSDGVGLGVVTSAAINPTTGTAAAGIVGHLGLTAAAAAVAGIGAITTTAAAAVNCNSAATVVQQLQQQQQQIHQQSSLITSNMNMSMNMNMNALNPSANPLNSSLNIPILSGGNQSCTNSNTQNMADYLAQLIKDKKQLAIFPNLFLHVDRILDEEITRVRSNLFHLFDVKNEPLDLPEALGPVISMSEKVYVPVKEYPDFNFVGRILGPRGMTAKQLEQETGCKIMVRGKGSMRDKKKEEQNRGKPNWEHLNDELHVLITVDDSENRGKLKLQKAIDEVGKLLVPVAEGEDELKKRQLMELAIINGTYRDSKESRNTNTITNAGTQQLVTSQVPLSALRAATPLGFYGAPLIISPHRLSNGLGTGASPGGPPPLLAQTNESLLYASPYTTSDYATYLSLAEYSPDHVGKMSAVRRLTGLRDHPYLAKTDPSSLLH